jgi:nucleoside-diphosphate-sugar epimerase
MAKILVTGAAGFIASRVCALLLEDGHTVVGVDCVNDAYDPRLKEHRLEGLMKRPGFTFHRLDISDLPALRPVFAEAASSAEPFAAVLNLAARAGVRPGVGPLTNRNPTPRELVLIRCPRDPMTRPGGVW